MPNTLILLTVSATALWWRREREMWGRAREGENEGTGRKRERFDNNGIYSRIVTRERMNYLHVGLEKGLS